MLKDRAVPTARDDDLPKLFKLATQNLPFLPSSASGESEVRKSLQQTLNGLHTAVQGICELRNQCGFASHGSGELRPPMEGVQARLAAEASDTIVGFLHRIHREDRTPPPSREATFDDNPEFNAYLDDAFGSIRVDAVEFQASDVLFTIEPETYRILLAEFDGPPATDDGEAGP
ncbi:MAG: abortive infection family protein [Chloroflexi bacterium]|nr:abortive infection family protein [Chloroflexota bacterium]